MKTKQDHILEFQHSFLNPPERQARNNFYGNNLVWVVDGLKRKNDIERFKSILKHTKLIAQGLHLYQLPLFLDDCSILKEWSECNGPVFFDFGAEFPLWCLLPKTLNGRHYVGPLPRQNFIELHNGQLTRNGQSFSELMRTIGDLISAYERPQQQISANRSVMQRRITLRNLNRQYPSYYLRNPLRRRRKF